MTGTGVGAAGALVTGNTFTGTVGGMVTLTGNTSIGGAGTLAINGAISGGAAVTKVGTGVTSFAGGATVPEPGTIGLLLVGALGMLNRRRRQA